MPTLEDDPRLTLALSAAKNQIPGVPWRIKEGRLFGEVYGTSLELLPNGTRWFVHVAGRRRVRIDDIEDAVDVLRDSLVRRRDALDRALLGAKERR